MIKKNKIFLLLLFSTGIYAAKINYTIVQSCVFNLTTCQISNCTDIFNDCLNTSEIHTKIHVSCYQAKAASRSFTTATYVAASVFFMSLIAFPLLNAGFEIASQRLPCCAQVAFKSKIETKMVDSVGKIFVKKLSSSLNALVTAAISFVTISWLFALWKGETVAQASCDYHSNPLDDELDEL